MLTDRRNKVVRKYAPKDFKPVFQFVEGIVAPGKFPTGVLGIADRDGIIGIEAYGSWPDGHKVKTDDIYPLFSVSKPISSIAAMQLWEKGKLHLDECVEDYIPGFGKNGKENITIWNLLTHTSGVKEDTLNEMLSSGRFGEDDLNQAITEASVNFPSGSHKSYSPRMALSILGAVVKRITGLDFDSYMEEFVFKPLGMKDTSFRIRRKTPERVLPIQNSEGYYYPREYDELVLPAGGIFSTAGDLLLLGKALLNNGMSDGCKLLSPYTLKEMTTPQTTGIPYWNAGPNMRGVEVGLGWFLPVNRHSIIKRNIYGHNGAGDCMFWVYPDEGLTFAFMTNYDFARDPQGADIDMIHNVFSSCLGG
jgi:CubicO group peptidase (beta-lactamase class C family)